MNLLALGTAIFVVGASAAPTSASSGTPAPTTTPAPAAATPAPAAAAARQRVLVLDVTGDLDKSARETLAGLIGARLARFTALDVIAKSGIARLIELESERQAVGCDGDDGACLAELAGALDVDTLAVANAGRLGGTTVFTLQLVDRAGKTVARGSTQVSALDDLATRVALVVDDVGQQATGAPPAPPIVAGADTMSSSTNQLPAGWKTPLLVGGGVGVGVGVVVGVAGLVPAVLYGRAASSLGALRADYVENGGSDKTLAEASETQNSAAGLQGLWNNVGIYATWGGITLVALGGGALAGGMLLEEAP
jgi:hypothetical protein